jgi:hypothetical protein
MVDQIRPAGFAAEPSWKISTSAHTVEKESSLKIYLCLLKEFNMSVT